MKINKSEGSIENKIVKALSCHMRHYHFSLKMKRIELELFSLL